MRIGLAQRPLRPLRELGRRLLLYRVLHRLYDEVDFGVADAAAAREQVGDGGLVGEIDRLRASRLRVPHVEPLHRLAARVLDLDLHLRRVGLVVVEPLQLLVRRRDGRSILLPNAVAGGGGGATGGHGLFPSIEAILPPFVSFLSLRLLLLRLDRLTVQLLRRGEWRERARVRLVEWEPWVERRRRVRVSDALVDKSLGRPFAGGEPAAADHGREVVHVRLPSRAVVRRILARGWSLVGERRRRREPRVVLPR